MERNSYCEYVKGLEEQPTPSLLQSSFFGADWIDISCWKTLTEQQQQLKILVGGLICTSPSSLTLLPSSVQYHGQGQHKTGREEDVADWVEENVLYCILLQTRIHRHSVTAIVAVNVIYRLLDLHPFHCHPLCLFAGNFFLSLFDSKQLVTLIALKSFCPRTTANVDFE